MDALGPVCGLVINIAKTVSPRVPARLRLPDFEGKKSLSLEQLEELLHASEMLLVRVPFGEDLKPGPYLPSKLVLSFGSSGPLSRRVRSALLRLSAVREFPKIMLNGEELLEAIDATLPCQIRPNAARELDVELQVVDTKVSYGTRHGLRDVRAKDVVVTQRDDLIPWTAAILYPLRNILGEVGIRGDLPKAGILDEDFSRITSFDFEHRFIDRPRSLPTTSGSDQSRDKAAGL